MMFLNTFLLLLAFYAPMVTLQRDCSQQEYDKCLSIAEPLIKEAHLVFPDNINDINLVCHKWNELVDCLKAYTDNCFNDQEKRIFNKAVESPIESVHQMCMQPAYRKEYLKYAPCIRRTIVDRAHCGMHYNSMVEQVEQRDVTKANTTLCCSYERFKQCVIRETRRSCDRGVSDGPAARFAAHTIDKALKYLQDQCINYIPNSGDCYPHDSYSGRSDSSPAITASNDPWTSTTVQQQRYPQSYSTTGRGYPSSIPPRIEQEILPTQYLDSRTRPGSYGKSIGHWSLEDTAPTTATTPRSLRYNNGNSAPPYTLPEPSSTTHHESSSSVYQPHYGGPSTTWYPAAGNQISNEVDEPNQLGWKKPKNSSNSPMSPFKVILIFFCWIVRTTLVRSL